MKPARKIATAESARNIEQDKPTAADALWSSAEVATYFGVDQRTLRRWVSGRRIPPPDIRIGRRTVRWRQSTIEKFIKEGK